MRKFFLATVLLALAAPVPAQQPDRWLATWAASTFAGPPRPAADSADRVPTYANQTVRQVVRTTLDGNRLRVRLTNEYGDQPLVIGAAHVAIRDSGSAIRPGSDRTLTFGGRRAVTLQRGAVIFSDPLDVSVPALTDLAISLWVRDSVRINTLHPLALQTSYVSTAGNFAAATTMPVEATFRRWIWLGGVDVVNPAATGVIVTLGNSITDGAGSSADANSRWPDVLARRLLASSEPPKAVVNAGISGNGVLYAIAGPSALSRFNRDVLMQPGVTHVIVLEGINDLGRGTGNAAPGDSVTAQDIIFAYQQLIARAHERGLVIFGATLTPMANLEDPLTPAIEAKRKAVNRWIRNSGAFDAVIDFDAATADPAHPDWFLPAYDSGDHLHPGDAGYRAMGESIRLELFRMTRRP